ncbi:MAG: hypothetical protein M1833_001388 [Piccolia ochrophora]|nr:MAG: hypothetical protein M1833_001388 [Piccolia ochrophora]
MHSVCKSSAVAAAAALLIAHVYGNPVPQEVAVIGFEDTARVCAMKYDDPQATWVNSGAAKFLNDFLVKNGGSKEWANKIDQATTRGGSQGESNLNCISLRGDNCRSPTVACEDYTPPALHFIRNAMFSCHAIFKSIHQSLQENTILNILDLDNIVSDFGAGTTEGSAQTFALVDSSLSIAAGVAAGFAPAAGTFAVIASSFGILGALDSPPEPTGDLKNQLSAIFSASQSQLEETLATIFGGPGDTSKLAGVTSSNGPNGETQDIAKFFSGGKFLIPVTEQGGIDEIVKPITDRAALLIKQSLVSTTLKSLNFYIFVNTDRSESDCGSITGSRFIDNQCFTLEKHGKTAGARASLRDTTEIIDKEIMLKLDDPAAGYNIDVTGFYRNADACQTAHPDFDGTLASNNLPTDGSLPECFFNIPVIKAPESPCLAIQKGQKLPENLGFSESNCAEQGKPEKAGQASVEGGAK